MLRFGAYKDGNVVCTDRQTSSRGFQNICGEDRIQQGRDSERVLMPEDFQSLLDDPLKECGVQK